MRKKLLFEFPDSEMIEVKLAEGILGTSDRYGIQSFGEDDVDDDSTGWVNY